MPESTPFSGVLLRVTFSDLPTPTFLSKNELTNPLVFKLTASPATRPDKVASAVFSTAAIVPSYTLFTVPTLLKTNEAGVILPPKPVTALSV